MAFCCRAAVMSAAFFVSLPGLALAEDVTLRARSGAMEVTGTLVSFDGETYRLDSRWGRLTFEASAVDCEGPGCPELRSFAPELRILAEPAIAGHVLTPLLEAWAQQEGLSLASGPGRWTLMSGDQPRLKLRLLPLPEDPARALAEGDADAALVMPDPLTARGEGTPVAQLPLVLASAPDAPPGVLSRRALQEARRGGTGWAALTGEDRPLVWHSPGAFADQAAIQRFGAAAVPPQRADGPAAAAEALRRDPWGLALLPAPLPEGLTERALSDSCGLIRDASPFALAAGEHPLAVSLLWLGADRRLPAEARRFADFATRQEGRAFRLDDALPLTSQGTRLANALLDQNPELSPEAIRSAVAELAGGRRLTQTIRYDDTGAPDPGGRAAVERLARLADAGAFAGHRILFAGFTPSAGSQTENLRASEALAAAQRRLFEAALPAGRPHPAVLHRGFGEALPIACDDSPDGAWMNRRVEIWLLPGR